MQGQISLSFGTNIQQLCLLLPGKILPETPKDLQWFPVSFNYHLLEYFKELAIGPECPTPTPLWKGYMDDVITTIDEQVDTLFNHLNSVDPNLKFTMETPSNDGSIPFIDTKFSPNSDYIMQNLSIHNQTMLIAT